MRQQTGWAPTLSLLKIVAVKVKCIYFAACSNYDIANPALAIQIRLRYSQPDFLRKHCRYYFKSQV
jgi:hypothetical protein